MKRLHFFFSLVLMVIFFKANAGNGLSIEIENTLKRVERKTGAVPNLKAILVICDNYVSPENNRIAQGVRVDLASITQMLGILEKRGIAVVQKNILQGRSATLPNVINAIKTTQTGADDIVFFYFSGHGGMASGKSFLYTAEEKELMRSDLQSLINAKSARFKMIVTDACNNETEGGAASRSLNRGSGDAQEGKFDPVYKELFQGYQGLMHLSASSEGEYAWSNDHMGGFFTHYFVKEGLIKNPANSWQAIFGMAKEKTMQMFNKISAEERSELAAHGIKNQTAKAFAMPAPKGNTTPVVVPVNTTAAKPATILLENYTGKNVTFRIDRNTDMNNWQASKVETKTIAPNGKVQLTTVVMVGFIKGKEDLYYDLETGNYFFDIDEYGAVDLYLAEEGKSADEVSQKDYKKILAGAWEWEDEDENIVVTTFNAAGTFTDKSGGETLASGKWIVDKEVDEEEGISYPIVKFVMKDGSEVTEMRFVITQEEKNIVQLIYYATLVNGEVHSTIDDEAEDFNPVLVLYRKK